MVRKALLLDSSYYPIQIIDWKRAMILFFTGRAEVIEHHDNINIKATTESFQLPKVMRLFQNFKNFSKIKFNRANVFYRDKYLCQYCSDKFDVNELSFDHVMPRSRGGATNWENIVTCCHSCNNKKSDRTPKEWGKALLKKPIEPRWTPMMAFKLGTKELNVFSSWLHW